MKPPEEVARGDLSALAIVARGERERFEPSKETR